MKRPIQRPMLKPSDLRAEAQRLIRAGQMPSLETLLTTIAEVKRNPHPAFCADIDAKLDDDAETLLIRNKKGGSPARRCTQSPR